MCRRVAHSAAAPIFFRGRRLPRAEFSNSASADSGLVEALWEMTANMGQLYTSVLSYISEVAPMLEDYPRLAVFCTFCVSWGQEAVRSDVE